MTNHIVKPIHRSNETLNSTGFQKILIYFYTVRHTNTIEGKIVFNDEVVLY